jgi:hypothetical protein
MSTTHSQNLIEKWRTKNRELIKKYNDANNDKTIANGVERVAIDRERAQILSFITDLMQPIEIKESDLLPSQYIPVQMPSFNGKGNHNVLQLEEIIEGFLEFSHQMRVREQSLIQLANIQIVK